MLLKHQQTPSCGSKMVGRALVSNGTFILEVSFLSYAKWMESFDSPARSLVPVGLTPQNKARPKDYDLPGNNPELKSL